MPDFILLYIFMWFLPMQINLSPGVGHIVSYTQRASTSGVCFTEFHPEIIKVFQWDKTNVVYWDILYKCIHKKKIHGVENRRCYLVLVKKDSSYLKWIVFLWKSLHIVRLNSSNDRFHRVLSNEFLIRIFTLWGERAGY